LENDTQNGGLRIFPGKRYAVDPSASIRSKVSLEAEIGAPMSGITVTFRVFDVDDPFDQNNPTMPNVGVIDADTSGPDNRPVGTVDPGVGTWTGTTDANGKARVDITVSMQPGNNYRAAASTVPAGVAQLSQADADGQVAHNCIVYSDMLTVWRKLHVETDSMGPVTNNKIDSPFTGIVGSGTSLTEINGLYSLDDLSANLDKTPPGNGRFENGIVTVGDVQFMIAIGPITANGSNRVVFPSASIAGLPFSAVDNDTWGNGTIGGTIADVMKVGINYDWRLNVTAHNEDPIDWPDFVGGTLTVGGGAEVPITAASDVAPQLRSSALNIPCSVHDDDVDSLLPKLPDTSTLAAAYAPAYVVPVYDVGDNDANVPFVLNVADNDAAIDAVLDWVSRSLNAPEFWVVYILQSFQGPAPGEDADPDSEALTLGMTPSRTGGSLSFIETIYDSTANPPGRLSNNVVHETGHAVADSADEPVTDGTSNFVANYLGLIRDNPSPSP